MRNEQLVRDAVLRVGEVSAVEGRRIFVKVDRNKNLSDMFLDGDILTNIAVNSFVEIRKGFLSIIGRVEGERIQLESASVDRDGTEGVSLNAHTRVLTVSLSGYVDERGSFAGGTKELPLIGDEAFLLTREKIQLIHNLVPDGQIAVSIAALSGDDIRVNFPIDGLFNSHIAIFGNTGSGKTNTLAALYSELFKVLAARNAEKFLTKTQFLLLDFNGEYGGAECLTQWKKVYRMSTRGQGGDKLPLDSSDIFDVEVLSILAEATEKTQKPFIKRALRLIRKVSEAGDSDAYMRQILKARAADTLRLADKGRAVLLLDYFSQILPEEDANGEPVDLESDLEWHNLNSEFKLRGQNVWLRQDPARVADTVLHHHIDGFRIGESAIGNLIDALYLQLISDVLTNRAQNEHIAPLINRLVAKKRDIDKLFDFSADANFWSRNVAVVNLHDVSLEMRKTIPLLLVRKLYKEQKANGAGKTLTIVIDEAHNILSLESSREAETWKDYRLETFEEIIKEGRKFGVFLTLSSQRPSDISPTIVSQCHNYFTHRLVNQLDLKMISTAVSYIDRVTEESIPTLPTGTCVFSGVVVPMPLKLSVDALPALLRPESSTRSFLDIVPALHVNNG